MLTAACRRPRQVELSTVAVCLTPACFKLREIVYRRSPSSGIARPSRAAGGFPPDRRSLLHSLDVSMLQPRQHHTFISGMDMGGTKSNSISL